MASRNIVKSDLLKLIPDYNEGSLPPELVALAETYISQARHMYITPSEAPAKNFACTQIACEQLSTKLGLPELNTSHTPIQPAKYKSFYKRLRSEAIFKQVRDSGRSNIDTRRRIARDQAQELCSKFSHVPIANVLSVLDRVLPEYRKSDLRALVAAVYLLCLQTSKKTKSISVSVAASLVKSQGLTKTELEQEVAFVRQKSEGQDWFDFSIAKAPDLSGEPPKKKFRIAQVRMANASPDFDSPKYQQEYQAWKANALTKLAARISELEAQQVQT